MSSIKNINGMYDIGLVASINYNYGNNLTNFALFTTLKKMGLSVLLLDAPVRNRSILSYMVIEKFKLSLFLNNPYNANDICDEYDSRWEIIDLNDYCHMFMIGSDQLWRAAMFVEPTDYYTCLDWVYSCKYKMSYATSIGIENYDGDPERFAELIKRFQKISVREQSSVKVIKELTGMEVKFVADPVFLLHRDEYRKIFSLENRISNTKDYICLYLLDRDQWKEQLAMNLLDKYTDLSRIIGITDVLAKNIDNTRIDYSVKPYVEEWLALIDNASLFITDSFHGVCFALIFRKNFIVTFNKNSFRGFERIKSLMEYLGIYNRIVFETTASNKIRHLVEEKIDYNRINKKLQDLISESKQWLESVVQEGKAYKGSDFEYDSFLISRYAIRQKKYIEQIDTCKKANFMLMKEFGATDGIVGWGAGHCFYENIVEVRKITNIKYICDNDNGKWGKELFKGVYGISPDEVYKMKAPLVLIMTENDTLFEEIKEQLVINGIDKYISITEWYRKINCILDRGL